MDQFNVRHESARHRFVLFDGEKEIGELTYLPRGEETVIANHTYVEASYNGQGLAGRLLDGLVHFARQEKIKILPTCPYIVRKFQQNPEKYEDVVAQ